MSRTVAELRAAVRTALAAEGLRLDDQWGGSTPYVLMAGAGSDFELMLSGQVRLSFRLMLVHGKATEQLSGAAIAADTTKMLSAMLGLSGVRLDSLSPEGSRDLGGQALWSVDLGISALITLPGPTGG